MGLMKFQRFMLQVLVMAGLASPALSYAIVGGVEVAAGEMAGQVALVDLSRDAGSCTGSEAFCKQFCSGTLIARQWVMTAAHCVNGVLLSDLRVVAGTRDLSAVTASGLLAVSNRYVHGQYAIGATFNNDIALLKLESPVGFPVGSVAEPGAFAAFEAQPSGHDDGLMVSGWGRLSSAGAFPAGLRRVAIDRRDNPVCEDVYNSASYIRYVADSMVCAAETSPADIEMDDAGDLSPHDEEGEGVCNYDSGGPLVFSGNGFMQVAGLTSFAPSGDCASASLPSVFTRVSSFASWIEATGKDAGALFGDLSLDVIDGGAAAAPGGATSITVRLRNASALPAGVVLPPTSLSGAGFKVLVPAGVSLVRTSSSADLNCVAIAGGYQCTSTTLFAPSGTRDATFTVTPPAGNQVVEISASVFADAANNLVDYRAGNDRRVHRILFSSQPDVALELNGFAQQVVNVSPASADGRAWVMARLANRSTAQTATNVSLALALSTGMQWEAYEGLAECVAQACVLPSLAPGEVREFRIRVFSPGAITGSVRLTASASNGDFPSVVSGRYDECDAERVVFNVVSSAPEGERIACAVPAVSSPAAGGGGSGGGSIGWEWLLLFVLMGWRRR